MRGRGAPVTNLSHAASFHSCKRITPLNRGIKQWRDAPREYGPPKTLYNRWKRWGDKGIFARMMEGLASEAAVPKTVMIDATYLKAHRTATSLRSKKGGQATKGAA